MFKTTDRSALFVKPRGPDGIQFWAHVEHEALWPWYYLRVVQDLGEEELRTMLMLASASELADIVAARTDTVWLEEAYLATPANVNDSGSWKLEPLVEVAIYRNDRSFPAGARYVVSTGKVYCVGELSSFQHLTSEKIFDADFHLGRVNEIPHPT